MFPNPWDELPEIALCTGEVYAHIATYLTDVYVQDSGRNKGDFLALDSVLGYLGALVNLASAKFRALGSPDTKMFFTCLDKNSTSESAKWYSGLKKNISRKCFERSKSAGESMDQSEVSVYLHHVRAMVSPRSHNQRWQRSKSTATKVAAFSPLNCDFPGN